MFVQYCLSEVSEVDQSLSKVNVLLTEINTKLSRCPFIPRKDLLSRISPILSEIEWTVYLTQNESKCDSTEDDEEKESLAWDSAEDFTLYEEDDGDDNESSEDDDHGPIKFSDSESDDEVFPPHPSQLSVETKEDFVKFILMKKEMGLIGGQKASPAAILRAPEWGPPLPVSSDEDDENIAEGQSESVPDTPAEDDNAKYVKEMTAKINLLAPDGKYKVTKPLKYKVDFNKMNSHFIRNIPEPFFYPVLGCSQDPDFYRQEGMLTNPERNYYNKSLENRNYRYPHGGIYGYDTDVGIVPVPAEPIHGHVWKNGHEIRNRNDGKWIVHAEVDDGLPSKGSWSSLRRRG